MSTNIEAARLRIIESKIIESIDKQLSITEVRRALNNSLRTSTGNLFTEKDVSTYLQLFGFLTYEEHIKILWQPLQTNI
jgi:hypothetical protein